MVGFNEIGDFSNGKPPLRESMRGITVWGCLGTLSFRTRNGLLFKAAHLAMKFPKRLLWDSKVLKCSQRTGLQGRSIWIYPLVMTNIAMENPFLEVSSWENHLFLWAIYTSIAWHTVSHNQRVVDFGAFSAAPFCGFENPRIRLRAPTSAVGWMKPLGRSIELM
jgi:hypothetical protein